MAEAKPWTYLKTRVYRITKTYVLVCGFLLAWLDLRGLHIKWAGPPSIPAWALSGGTALATLLVILLDAVPGDHLKAALVFWRWNNPLPGCRAFLRTNLEKDSRISIERLRARLGGKFPRSPTEQNATWYRLYKSVSTEPEVAGLHYEYLLFRDLTWFTVVIAVLAILSLVING